MARPPESRLAPRVIRDAGVWTWEQYLDKVRKGEIWGGACQVGRWAQSKGCRIAMYREWGPKGGYRRMAEVCEGKRTAAALLWSTRGGGYYELLWPREEEEAEAVVEAEEGDANESAGEEEVELDVDVEEEGQWSGGGQGGQAGEQVWQDVHQIQMQERGAGWRYQGQEGPMRERRRAQSATGNYEQDGKVC